MNGALAPQHVTAIVPCHRDAPSPALLHAIRRHVGGVVVVLDRVDERSTRALARGAGADTYEFIELSGRTGKGSAVAVAIEFLLARTPAPSAVMVVDADGQHPPDAIPSFLAAGAEAELVIGDRFTDLRHMPWKRRVANGVAAWLLSLATGVRVRDTQCGMRLLRGRAARDAAAHGWVRSGDAPPPAVPPARPPCHVGPAPRDLRRRAQCVPAVPGQRPRPSRLPSLTT